MSEFSRIFDRRALPGDTQTLTATAEECAALAKRFGLIAVHSLTVTVTLIAEGPTVRVRGSFKAGITQSCAVSGEDLPARIAEPLALRFVPPAQPSKPDEEVELTAEELDDVEMTGTQFDLGEAIAQELVLAVDPYAEGPGAAAFRLKAGIVSEGQAGPFAGLAALKKDLE